MRYASLCCSTIYNIRFSCELLYLVLLRLGPPGQAQSPGSLAGQPQGIAPTASARHRESRPGGGCGQPGPYI